MSLDEGLAYEAGLKEGEIGLSERLLKIIEEQGGVQSYCVPHIRNICENILNEED